MCVRTKNNCKSRVLFIHENFLSRSFTIVAIAIISDFSSFLDPRQYVSDVFITLPLTIRLGLFKVM
jgi:hypothetical protein